MEVDDEERPMATNEQSRDSEPDPVAAATPPGRDNHPEVERSSRAPKLGIVLAVVLGLVAVVLLLEVTGLSLAG
jgi:hypothetical protein